MASHHKLIAIGRLPRDPIFTPFSNGGGVAKFSLPLDFTRSKKNPQTGQWEGGDSFFINVDVFNRDFVKLADMVMQYLKKGNHVYVEGRLKNNEYVDKTGTKVARPVLVADVVKFLDGTGAGVETVGEEGASGARPAPQSQSASRRPAPSSFSRGGGEDVADEAPSTQGGGGGHEEHEDDIPF